MIESLSFPIVRLSNTNIIAKEVVREGINIASFFLVLGQFFVDSCFFCLETTPRVRRQVMVLSQRLSSFDYNISWMVEGHSYWCSFVGLEVV
jgi:hypothetical protein